MVLAPSVGFGGGIERVATAIERCLGEEVVRVDLYRRTHTRRTEGSPGAKALFALRALGASARARPCLVLALHVGLLPVALAVAAACRARVGLLGIGHEVWCPLGRATRAMIGRCDPLLAISSFTADVLSERSGARRGRIEVLTLPVDEALLRRAQEDPSAPTPHGGALVSVARLSSQHRYKGHFAIAASLPEVLRRHPHARWVVVGDGDDADALRRRCRELGVAHAVDFAGLVSDEQLAAIYRAAAALVLPSVADSNVLPPTGEGFGLVYVEAGAFGVPSIASRSGGGAADFVVHEETGVTVPPNDSGALADAIVHMLDDEPTRRRLGEAARARALTDHIPARFCAQLRESLRLRTESPR